MTKSLYPKALVYKEWHQKRWVALFVFLLICPSVYLNTLMPLQSHRYGYTQASQMVNGVMQMGPLHRTDIWALNFSTFCNQVMGRYTIGWWASLVIVGLALYTLWSERHDDIWSFTLSGPISKRQLLRTKWTFDVLIIVITFTVLAVSLMIIDASVNLHYPLQGIVKWWFAEIAIQFSMYSLALLLGMFFGNIMAAGVSTFVLANIPMKIGVLLVLRLGANPIAFSPSYHKPVPTSWKWMWIFTHLSPLNWLSTNLTGAFITSWYFMTGFVVFSLAAYLLAQVLYQRAANERLSSLFIFSGIRFPLMGLLSAAVAFLFVQFPLHTLRLGTSQKVELFVVITVLVWLAATAVSRPLQRRF